ncbi:severin [Anaeramoeba flamelloides]|uniref:Severin n=1 Tax=Anaeramoeba flamelloides TaxID=1746091 RepID=A0ABQ8X679_9EUKA|nr:severin [Anaeramoeba flamelloides]
MQDINEFDEAWKGVGKTVGLKKWRIEKFKVIEFSPFSDFFEGDAFIVLHTWKKENLNTLYHDIYFWLGKDSTQDEQGTAAYKTVELDTYLGGAPIQHREVQGYESQQFLDLFEGGIRYLKGGIDSGFNHIEPEKYTARLFHIKGKKKIRVQEVPLEVASLNEGDCFVLDSGLDLYQWHGKKSNFMEKRKASEVSNSIKGERKGQPTIHVMDQSETSRKFWNLLGGKAKIKSAQEGGDDLEFENQKTTKSLWLISDESGELKFSKVSEGSDVNKSQLDTNDVFLLDTGFSLLVWCGLKSTKQEKAGGIKFAMDYLTKNNKPLHTPIARYMETGETDLFWKAFN